MKAILARPSTQWIILNLLGMAVYLISASRHWVSAVQFGEPGGPGDAFYVAFLLWPLLLFFAVLDFTALVVIVRRFTHGHRSYAAATWLAVSTAWIDVIILEHHLAFNIVDRQYV
jgi:phosphate starvation-inducible membrane PsiE